MSQHQRFTKVYLDSETCGLHSMAVLFQYAYDDGEIFLYDIWKEPIGRTLELIEHWCTGCVVGFNLVFDWFHVCKIYTVFRQFPSDWIPEQHIEEIALAEPAGMDGPCVKPAGAMDLLLHSRKGPYQSLMAREPIKIRRVPTELAYALADELEQRIKFEEIYFARSKNKDAPKWKVYDIQDRPELKNVCLNFNPAGGLKFLAEHALGYKPKFHYKDIEPPPEWRPREVGYAPTALALSQPEKDWLVYHKDRESGKRKCLGPTWPGVIQKFIDFWATNENAREYANDDIVLTRMLDEHFGCPEINDDDSILACMVAAIRWHGLRIDKPGIKRLMKRAFKIKRNRPINTNKPTEVRRYLSEMLDETEMQVIEQSTKKANVEKIAAWEIESEEDCTKCFDLTTDERVGCSRCGGTGVLKPGVHPAAKRAKEILAVKIAEKEYLLYKKLLRAGRFHAAFTIVGTKSNRMSGAGSDGLNPQGINRRKDVRKCFPLAWDKSDRPKGVSLLTSPDDVAQYVLSGGDFDGFEVTLADAVYNDEKLREDLLSGKKIHALFGLSLYPNETYESICESKDTENDMYTAAKSGVFAMIYGGDWGTLMRNLGIPEEVAKGAYDDFVNRYPGVGKAREKTFQRFCTMQQPGGIGTRITWTDPDDYVESFLGFRRYFTLENQVCKELFHLAQKPPKGWRANKTHVQRSSGRIQTVGGAVSSALYGAAFGIQSSVMRAAANHEIQSPGGQITKKVQRDIWELQPIGVSPFVVAPMNVHDEIDAVVREDYIDRAGEQVRKAVESFRPKVPLIEMTWNLEMQNWAEKKGGSRSVTIAPTVAC